MPISASLVPYSKESTKRVLVLDPDLFSPSYYCDSKDKTKFDGSQSDGWYRRYALNVNGKYEDNVWLGASKTESGWPISFHGTNKDKVSNITNLLRVYLLSMSQSYGRGIYSSPSIEVAEVYAEEFLYNSHKYKVVFQNRVNPDGLKVIPADRICRDSKYSDVKDDCWMQTRDAYIRPCAICVKKC